MKRILLLLIVGVLFFFATRAQGQFYSVRQFMSSSRKHVDTVWATVNWPIEVRVFEKMIWIIDHLVERTLYCRLDSLRSDFTTPGCRTKTWSGTIKKKKALIEIVYLDKEVVDLLHWTAQLNIRTKKFAFYYRLNPPD